MFESLFQAGAQALGFGEDDEDRTRRERMQRYRDAMQRAQSYGTPSGVGNVAAQMAAMHAAGGQHLQGAANQVMGAIAAENQSRVAQLREMRRMEHEKELLRMQQEAEMQRAEMMLRRLEGQQKLAPGVISRLYIDGRGNRSFRTA